MGTVSDFEDNVQCNDIEVNMVLLKTGVSRWPLWQVCENGTVIIKMFIERVTRY